MEQFKIQHEDLDKIFFCLSDPHRRSILSLLVSQDLTVGVIAKKTKITIASASKHLQVLVRCELISKARFGRSKLCKINFVKLSEANAWLSSIGLLNSLDISKLEDFLSTENIL